MTPRPLRYGFMLALAAAVAGLAPVPGAAQEGEGGGNAPTKADLECADAEDVRRQPGPQWTLGQQAPTSAAMRP